MRTSVAHFRGMWTVLRAAFDIPYEALDYTKFKAAIVEYPGGRGYAMIQLPGSCISSFFCEFEYDNQDRAH